MLSDIVMFSLVLLLPALLAARALACLPEASPARRRRDAQPR